MVLPIGGFMPIPLAMMIPFMATQSMVMGDAFGRAFQYGKRKISAMTNEEFNATSLEEQASQMFQAYKNIIPDLKQSIADSATLQRTIINEMLLILPKFLSQTGDEIFKTDIITTPEGKTITSQVTTNGITTTTYSDGTKTTTGTASPTTEPVPSSPTTSVPPTSTAKIIAGKEILEQTSKPSVTMWANGRIQTHPTQWWKDYIASIRTLMNQQILSGTTKQANIYKDNIYYLSTTHHYLTGTWI